jgi:hypothetical protein
MSKQPTIKIGDRIRCWTDDNKLYTGECIKMTEKGIRCKWDHLPVELSTVLLYKNYGKSWEKVKE